MMEVLLKKASGAEIPCIAEFPEGCSRAVIVIHGFCSSKESSNAVNLFQQLIPRGIGVIAYDQPGHGSAEAREDELRVPNCLDSLARVEQYVRETLPAAEVCYFGSSFGAYILGSYLATRPHAGRRAFLRCAAVNFPELIQKHPHARPGSAKRAELAAKGYIDLTLGGTDVIRITEGFLEDLEDYDLFRLFEEKKPADVKFAMAHGAADPTVPVQEAEKFAAQFGYPITVFPGEGHTISEDPENPVRVAALAAELFTREG